MGNGEIDQFFAEIDTKIPLQIGIFINSTIGKGLF
jgi:hypothetical protein